MTPKEILRCFLLALVVVSGRADTMTPTWREKVFPEERRPQLKADSAYEVIVLAAAGKSAAVEAAVRKYASPPFSGGIERARLPLIGGLAAKASGKGLKGLAESDGVDRIWIVPRDFFDVYVRTIQAIAYNLDNDHNPGGINVSLGPPSGLLPMPYREDEPLNLATRRAAAAGKLTVFAAGNDGPKLDTLNPWCLADWVICVGAADVVNGKPIPWEKSSRGRPGDRRYRPSLLAPGVDVLTTHPPNLPKTEEQKAAEKRIDFDRRVQPEKRNSYTVVSGTSFAAPQVSQAAAQVVFFLQKALEAAEKTKDEGEPTIATIYTHFRLSDRDDLVRAKRLAGTIKDVGGAVVAIYPLRPNDPLVVKQILLDSAIPMPGYAPYEVGSGVVTFEQIAQLYGKFGLINPKLMILKVTQ